LIPPNSLIRFLRNIYRAYDGMVCRYVFKCRSIHITPHKEYLVQGISYKIISYYFLVNPYLAVLRYYGIKYVLKKFIFYSVCSELYLLTISWLPFYKRAFYKKKRKNEEWDFRCNLYFAPSTYDSCLRIGCQLLAANI